MTEAIRLPTCRTHHACECFVGELKRLRRMEQRLRDPLNADERAAMVVWLRSQFLDGIADAVERGEHRAAGVAEPRSSDD